MYRKAVTLYHNPHCSKSRQALQLLRENDVEVEIIDYMQKPLTVQQLADLSKILPNAPQAMIRTADSRYAELNAGTVMHEPGQYIQLLAQHPYLLQRPIIATETAAIIARPPETVLKFLGIAIS